MQPVPLESKIGLFAKELPALLEAAAKEGADKVAEDARSRVPVDTGALQEAIHTEPTEDGYAVVAGSNKIFYGRFVEHGTAHSAAHPFLIPALESKRAEILAEMSAAIRKAS